MKFYGQAQTRGDWTTLELPSGAQFRLSGPKRVEFANQVGRLLADVEPEQSLLQTGRLCESDDAPWISEVIPESGGTSFTIRADDDSEFTLTPSEVKVLLEG